MIAAGYARVGDQVGSPSCAAALLARENAARKAKLGLWADPYYDLIDAETPANVLAHKDQFALVEGRVVSVHESGPTIYLNFGRHWSEDFAVTVRKRNERNFRAMGAPRDRPRVCRSARHARQPFDRGEASGADRDRGSRLICAIG
jgi:hypothetical protein